jgi:hypothetical protein
LAEHVTSNILPLHRTRDVIGLPDRQRDDGEGRVAGRAAGELAADLNFDGTQSANTACDDVSWHDRANTSLSIGVVLASPNTLGHSPKARFVVTTMEVRS